MFGKEQQPASTPSVGLRAAAFAWSVAVLVTMLSNQSAEAQSYSVLYTFTGAADGENPSGTLAIDRAGNLYGAAGVNVIYKLFHRGSGWGLNPIYNFTGPPDGLVPNGVTIGPDGALYGSTWAGGNPACEDGGGCGTIFRLRPPASVCANAPCSWTDTILLAFDPYLPSGGQEPYGSPVFDSAGNLYDTIAYGGEYGGGMVYELTPAAGGWVETVLYSFDGGQGGANPLTGVVVDQAGNLYGTTSVAGDPSCNYGVGCGIVYKLSRSGSGWIKTNLYTFQGGTDGMSPVGGLVLDPAGNVYGTTELGGSGGGGTVFELSSGTWTFHLLASFTQYNPFSIGPRAALTIDSASNLYGTTYSDGRYGFGSVFKLARSNGGLTYSSLYDFTDGADGALPDGNVVLDASGNIYGTAIFGGSPNCSNGCGVAFEITP